MTRDAGRRTRQWLGTTRVAILGPGDIALGIALLAGGPLRTSSPSFHVIKLYAPIRAWGAIILLAGLALCLCEVLRDRLPVHTHEHLRKWAATAGAMWGGFWFTALALAAVDPKAALTGPVAYSFFFTLPHLALAYGRDR